MEAKTLKAVNWLAAEVRVMKRSMANLLARCDARISTLSATTSDLGTAEEGRACRDQLNTDYQKYRQSGRSDTGDFRQNMDYLEYMQGDQEGLDGIGDCTQYMDYNQKHLQGSQRHIDHQKNMQGDSLPEAVTGIHHEVNSSGVEDAAPLADYQAAHAALAEAIAAIMGQTSETRKACRDLEGKVDVEIIELQKRIEDLENEVSMEAVEDTRRELEELKELQWRVEEGPIYEKLTQMANHEHRLSLLEDAMASGTAGGITMARLDEEIEKSELRTSRNLCKLLPELIAQGFENIKR